MTRAPRPSLAQAKLLAELFAAKTLAKGIAVDHGYIPPTVRACIARGWIEGTGVLDQHPTRRESEWHRINDDGLFALECFLSDERQKRLFAARTKKAMLA